MKKYKYIVLLVILSLIVTREWFLPGLPQTHDAEVHISRSYAFFNSLSEGNILPRWAGHFNWTYGTPAIMFLYPIEPYASALIHAVTGLSFIDVYKFLLIFSYIGSGLAWNFWLRELKFSDRSAFVGSFFYLLAHIGLLICLSEGHWQSMFASFFFLLSCCFSRNFGCMGRGNGSFRPVFRLRC